MPSDKLITDKHDEAVQEEVVYQNPLLFLKIWEIASEPGISGQPKSWKWHYHKEVEFLAVKDGSLGIQSKHQYTILGPGDVMVLGASQLHRSHKPNPGPLRYIVFQVDLVRHFDQTSMPYLQCFSEVTEPLEKANYIFAQNETAKREAYAIIMDIYEESQSKQTGYEIAISALIRKLLLLLIRNDTRNMLYRHGENEWLRLRPVLDDVEERLAEKITVEDACALANMSYHYFMKFFKKTVGMTFLEYVNLTRIKKAERLLLTRDISIAEVSEEVGIPNIAQFYKMFKRYNQCSPKAFKNRMRSLL